MKRLKLGTILSIAFVMTCGVAFAQQTVPQQTKKRPSAVQRQVRQQKRIAQGVRSGQLTKTEMRKLERQQARIQRTKRIDKAMNGGKLTPSEKRHINRMQNRASKNIYNKKHNAAVRH